MRTLSGQNGAWGVPFLRSDGAREGGAIRPQATPSARLRLSRLRGRILDRARLSLRRRAAAVPVLLGGLPPRTLRLLPHLVVLGLILALPLGAAPASGGDGQESVALLAGKIEQRDALLQQRVPITVDREAPPEIRTYEVQEGDTLLTIAAHYGITVETIAYNNGITDPTLLSVGTVLRIPPSNAAIYTVKEQDTVASVAEHFKVDPKSIMEANRLHLETENFAAGRSILVPVPDSTYPGFQLVAFVPRRAEVTARLTGPVPPGSGRLAWPVAGVITQYFWYAHRGVDVAAPYGSGIAAADDGTVSATGWVPVGGLRACVRHDWGMETCYYHASVVFVNAGERVSRGQIIAAIGLTGVTTGPHVHWEARYNGALVNPLSY